MPLHWHWALAVADRPRAAISFFVQCTVVDLWLWLGGVVVFVVGVGARRGSLTSVEMGRALLWVLCLRALQGARTETRTEDAAMTVRFCSRHDTGAEALVAQPAEQLERMRNFGCGCGSSREPRRRLEAQVPS